MKIKQVEELVGITRKNIRFYEEQGLLNVERAENGYREYHTADIARLQEIKLFRKMDISIEEMRALFEKRKSLQFCLEQHLGELERRREGLVKMQEMCERLIAEHQSLDTLNAENCLEEIEQMEKEGARFMDIKKTDIRKKRRTGAIIGAVVHDLAYGIYHRAYAVGQYTRSHTDRTADISDRHTGCDHRRNPGSTCRTHERD